uniref:hypothetical protein n=1 Tax=Winogradskyella sp. TaxID=1883156 RepID=UPI0025D3293A
DIAEEEGADLEMIDEVISYTDGSRSPHLVYKMNIDYKGKTIHFVNKTGTEFYGLVTCDFPKVMEKLDFEISTRSHFISLFVGSNQRIKVKTQSAQINSFFKQSSAFRELRRISKDTVFEPSIIGTNVNGKYNITTKYSLQFTDWTRSIQPIIQLQKQFVDYFS